MSSYEQCLTKITTKFLFQDGPNSNRNTGDDLRPPSSLEACRKVCKKWQLNCNSQSTF